jgi:cytochrome c
MARHRIPALLALGLSAAALLAGPALADPAAGRKAFEIQCSICHSVGTVVFGGEQGPNLAGVVGRKAGSETSSAALTKTGVTWDRTSLDSYLTDPAKFAPGTIMVVNVADAKKRADLIDFLASVK